jgi:membrane protease YdiL (CAAX protease family)
MSKKSLGRNLSTLEHVQLSFLAFGNAVCEEVVSRGFFYHEFRVSAQLSPGIANVAQALAFGIWHYNGIPSGFTGIGLTSVYGLMMGLLRDYGGGILLPIIAHTVADYFIFAVIVRRK